MLFGIHGKKQHGKDTVGSIIQVLLDFPKVDNDTVKKYLQTPMDNPSSEIKKFAYTLKQMVSFLTNIPIEELEKEKVKNTVLYTKYALIDNIIDEEHEYEDIHVGLKQYETLLDSYIASQPYTEEYLKSKIIYEERQITVRTMLERIGTEIGRQIHSMLWIDILFKDYVVKDNTKKEPKLPTWIITDVRFFNEYRSIINRSGFTIKVINPYVKNNSTHISETALDHINKWDIVFVNDGSLNDLINKVRDFLKDKNLI